MAYYAQIVSDIVTEVIVVNDDVTDGAQFAHDLLGGQWVETFIDDPNKNYAGIGYKYDPVTENFIAPQPFKSWKLDANGDWQPPTPKPEGNYYWTEKEKLWVKYD